MGSVKRKLALWGCILLAGCFFASKGNTYQAAATFLLGWGQETALGEAEQEWVEMARDELADITADRNILALVYLTDSYAVRESADADSAVVANVPSGQTVQIRDVAVNSLTDIWEYVCFYYGGQECCGYIERQYLACSDEVFLAWEEDYGLNPGTRPGVMTLDGEGTESDAGPEVSGGDANPEVSGGDAGGSGEGAGEEKPLPEDIAQFPESYREALLALKEAHPNWTFVKMNTGLKWSEVVDAQMVRGRNLIPSSFPLYMQDGIHSPNWAYITEDALAYYLDPRNGLNEETIFQFEQLTYNASYHTEEAVQAFLDNTFMSGIIPDTVLTYAKTFFAVGKELGVSPFHLACRVYQEQGSGDSQLISGTYPGYEGYYNYFNIGAAGTTTQEVIVSGLELAKKENWYNGYYSIYGGAKIISSNYILHGQDTLYLQKFDVDDSADGLYWHQYMQNVCAPTSEGHNISKSYANAGSLENTFVFKIPVYEDMPEEACAKPTVSYTVTLEALEGYDDAVVYLDGVPYQAVKNAGRYQVEAADGAAKTAVMYSYNEKGIPTGMYVWELKHNGAVYQVTALPQLENLLTYHGFSIRITGKSGIRFKTGIEQAVRSQLLTEEGLAGYRLKEYGTLVMTRSNMGQYPFVKGGEKVRAGVSYGMNGQGVLQDLIYEAVDGRLRYTSVLVGLPADQYETEFAFKGYIVLSKEGQEDITLYGPAVWRSIYNLSKQVLDLKMYPEGSDADVFLKKLISDADALKATEETQVTQQ